MHSNDPLYQIVDADGTNNAIGQRDAALGCEITANRRAGLDSLPEVGILTAMSDPAAMTPEGWDRNADGLHRTFQFSNFKEAVGFVAEVGRLAEESNHHPDIDIRWNRVALSFITHDAGNTITDKDVASAGACNLIQADSIKKQAAAIFGSE